MPVAVAVLLTWVQVADALVLYEVSLPLIAVCGIALYRRRGQLAGQWYELSLIAAAALALQPFPHAQPYGLRRD